MVIICLNCIEKQFYLLDWVEINWKIFDFLPEFALANCRWICKWLPWLCMSMRLWLFRHHNAPTSSSNRRPITGGSIGWCNTNNKCMQCLLLINNCKHSHSAKIPLCKNYHYFIYFFALDADSLWQSLLLLPSISLLSALWSLFST